MQESLSGSLIATCLDQDVQYDAVLIDGSPQLVTMTTDANRDFIEMPFVARSRSSFT